MIEEGLSLELGRLTTESVDERYRDLDTLPVPQLVLMMNDAEAGVPDAVRAAAPQIAEAIEIIIGQLHAGGRLFYIGAGTAGRIGILDASECPPTFSTDPEIVQGIIAGGDIAILHAVEDSEDDENAARVEIHARAIGPRDAVVGLSASGRTPFVVSALEAAAGAGARTIGVSCNTATPVSHAAEVGIEVVVGPEVLTGSTRLKAGSAQKQIVNMLSTISMIRLGKTYGNLMVDVNATNEKLRTRARDLVLRLTNADAEAVRAALVQAGQRVPVAVVMLRTGTNAREAETILAAAGGSLRRALGD